MMQKNLGKMMSTLAALQKKGDAIQKELAAATFEGSAADGLVRVQMSGKGELVRVTIDPSLLNEDAETLGDLVTVAGKKAYEAKEAMAKEKLASLAEGVMPFGLKVPGFG